MATQLAQMRADAKQQNDKFIDMLQQQQQAKHEQMKLLVAKRERTAQSISAADIAKATSTAPPLFGVAAEASE